VGAEGVGAEGVPVTLVAAEAVVRDVVAAIVKHGNVDDEAGVVDEVVVVKLGA
jgi:hypothetical protein